MEPGGTAMRASPNPLEWSARRVVDLVRAMAKRRILVSCIGLAVTLVVAFGYIAMGSLRFNPTRSMI